jgi:prolyl-tRNA synthetase
VKRSHYLLNTLKETPKEAVVISHQLMLRAGMIKQVASGIYTYMPFALRALRKIEAIIREELNRSGAMELLMPAVQPAELWQESGRWQHYGKELLRIKDRKNNEFCVGPTHEEVVTDVVRREVRSYKDLPLNLYQIQTKFRDEIRPRFGLMRGREFIMKDGYSFDTNLETATATYWRMHEAYQRIFQRCGLIFRPVEADAGNIGGSVTHEFHVLADSGEDAILSCTHCNYAANRERCETLSPTPYSHDTSAPPPREVDTPECRKIEEVAALLNATPRDCIKTVLLSVESGLVAAMVRGDREVNDIAVKNIFGSHFITPATDEEIASAGLVAGFVGPFQLPKDIHTLMDPEVLAMPNAITGANRMDAHLIGFIPSRDASVQKVAPIRLAQEGDTCPRCQQGSLSLYRGIEVGHIFLLGTKYSEAMQATYQDEQGQDLPMVMGCYGIGVGRTMAAAIEQNHDEHGIIWPADIAPFHVCILNLDPKDDTCVLTCDTLAQQLGGFGIDVMVDDRDQRPGFKFKDADLLGFPFQLVVGARGLQSGTVELKERSCQQKETVVLAAAVDTIVKRLHNRPSPIT